MIARESRTRSKLAFGMSGLWLFVIGIGSAMTYFLNASGIITVSISVVLAVASLGF